MTTWTKQKIGDLCALFDGPHATPKPSSDGPIFLGIGNLTENGRLQLQNINHISDHDFPKWTKRVTPAEGDIVFSYEATLNRYALIPATFNGCLGRRLALIRVDKSKVNSKYLYYYFFTNLWRKKVSENILKGATVDRIPLSIFPDFDVSIPDLNAQNSIASIVSTYDDLIEKNEKRIKILEEMAQRLYTEWFVKSQSQGQGKLSDLANLISGYPFKSSTYLKDGKYKIVTIKNVHDGEFVMNYDAYIDDLPKKLSSDCQLNSGEILLSLTGNVGRICIVYGDNHLLNQRVAKITPKIKEAKEYIYCMLRDIKTQKAMISMSNGAAQQNLSPIQLKNLEIIYPQNELLQKFHDITEPYFSTSLNLRTQNKYLSNMRDMLIPQLISGKREVK